MATSLFDGYVSPQQQQYEQQNAFLNQLGTATTPQSFQALVGTQMGRTIGGGLMSALGVKTPEQERMEKIQAAIAQVKGMTGSEAEKMGKLADLLEAQGLASDAYKLRSQARAARLDEAQIREAERKAQGDQFHTRQWVEYDKLGVPKVMSETMIKDEKGNWVPWQPGKGAPAAADKTGVDGKTAAQLQQEEAKAVLERKRAAAGGTYAPPPVGGSVTPVSPQTPYTPEIQNMPRTKAELQRELMKAAQAGDGARYNKLLAYGKHKDAKGW